MQVNSPALVLPIQETFTSPQHNVTVVSCPEVAQSRVPCISSHVMLQLFMARKKQQSLSGEIVPWDETNHICTGGSKGCKTLLVNINNRPI